MSEKHRVYGFKQNGQIQYKIDIFYVVEVIFDFFGSGVSFSAIRIHYVGPASNAELNQ